MRDLISRQAAKNVLANLGIDIEDYWEDAIDELPSVEPEKCGDCISRQAAIDAFERFIHELGISDEPYNYGEMALSAQNVPPVTPCTNLAENQGWIPVSERLPEEFESVLVCYQSQGGMAQCVSERLINMDGSNRWSALGGQDPIAWMPLHAPFKAEIEK